MNAPRKLVSFLTGFAFLVGCGTAAPAPTAEVHPTNTSLSPVATSTAPPTVTLLSPTKPPVAPSSSRTPEPEASVASNSFVDSGQRLGSARSVDVALGDLDRDGDLDAFVANDGQVSKGNAVWLNDGHGTFTADEQNPGSGTSVVLGDADGDGDLDAFVVFWDQEPGRVWLNDGSGGFVDSGQQLGRGNWFGLALADLDGDGDLDAFMAVASDDPNEVWLNNGDGSFRNSDQDLRGPLAHAVSLVDLDGDGDLDAFTAHGDRYGSTENRVWQNDGTGQFADSGLRLGEVVSFGVDLGDLDGDADVFVANSEVWREGEGGLPNEVWFNESVTGGGAGLIAFYSERDGNAEIYTMRGDGGDQRRLTFNEFEDSAPALSPS